MVVLGIRGPGLSSGTRTRDIDLNARYVSVNIRKYHSPRSVDEIFC